MEINIAMNSCMGAYEFFFFLGFPRCPQVFISRLILRGTVGRQGRDLSQNSLLHPQELELETTCLSDQNPFHSGQPLLVGNMNLILRNQVICLSVP